MERMTQIRLELDINAQKMLQRDCGIISFAPRIRTEFGA